MPLYISTTYRIFVNTIKIIKTTGEMHSKKHIIIYSYLRSMLYGRNWVENNDKKA